MNYIARVPENIHNNESESEKDEEKINILKEIEQSHNKNTHTEDIKHPPPNETEDETKSREVKINDEGEEEVDEEDEENPHSPYEKYETKNIFNVLEKDQAIQLDTIDNIEDYDIELIDENDLFFLPSYLTINEDVYRERDRDNIEAMKRSYNVMEILCSRSEYSDKLMKERAFIIGSCLLNVFLPNSDGNMNHFKKTWEYLIGLNKSAFVDLLISPDYLSHAFFDMLRYIHESAVMTALVKTIFSDFYSPEAQMKIYDHLNELDFLES
eukprot:jgi/Orpsp1_1/1190315/evm.model.d7180000078202.1